jgi:hypothetical protein
MLKVNTPDKMYIRNAMQYAIQFLILAVYINYLIIETPVVGNFKCFPKRIFYVPLMIYLLFDTNVPNHEMFSQADETVLKI